MISIIICSKKKEKSTSITNNIKETIGNLLYEIIWIDNSTNKYSIFSAYNEGVRKAKYEYLCFMHEDIIFHSDNWGVKIITSFSDKKIGALGVIGGYCITKYSTGWWDAVPYITGEVIQGKVVKGKYLTSSVIHKDYSYLGSSVVALDGLWMCIRKSLFIKERISFDENTFQGFHFYDLDICSQIISKQYHIHIIKDILIEHQSWGVINDTFYDNCYKYHKKWDKELPLCNLRDKEKVCKEIEINEFRNKFNSKKIIREQRNILNQIPHKIISKLYLKTNKFIIQFSKVLTKFQNSKNIKTSYHSDR